jgi:hypothetical protein
LQLLVGKELMPAEALVARAKRLMLFFTSPKQTEKLIEIQKKEQHLQTEVKIEFFIIYYQVNCLIKQLCFFLIALGRK